jgi:hypothetical protein
LPQTVGQMFTHIISHQRARKHGQETDEHSIPRIIPAWGTYAQHAFHSRARTHA